MADVYEEPYTSFLRVIADWIAQRTSSKGARLGLIFDVLRSETMIFGGVGVYTASEICYDAGTPFASHCLLYLTLLNFKAYLHF